MGVVEWKVLFMAKGVSAWHLSRPLEGSGEVAHPKTRDRAGSAALRSKRAGENRDETRMLLTALPLHLLLSSLTEHVEVMNLSRQGAASMNSAGDASLTGVRWN